MDVLRPELSAKANKALKEASSRCRKTRQVNFNRQKLGYFTKLNGRFFLSASEALKAVGARAQRTIKQKMKPKVTLGGVGQAPWRHVCWCEHRMVPCTLMRI